ncbi:MAG: YdeI/OmpD-associated family protein [Acidobacteria bacterium]|nr:YdeI/OmpD-associated family protein [Acidobacteriota bacterium]
MSTGERDTRRDLPILAFESRNAWEEWLAEHHASSSGIWLKIAKKGSGLATVSYSEALDAALCYGWIDGQKGKLDSDYWLQRFTPRRPRSQWSKINCERVGALIAKGTMRPAGLREVERAKTDGRWDAAYQGQRTSQVPDDLRRELESNDRAREFFATLSSANRYAILYRLQEAKKPETRARRLRQYVTMLSEGKKFHP